MVATAVRGGSLVALGCALAGCSPRARPAAAPLAAVRARAARIDPRSALSVTLRSYGVHRELGCYDRRIDVRIADRRLVEDLLEALRESSTTEFVFRKDAGVVPIVRRNRPDGLRIALREGGKVEEWSLDFEPAMARNHYGPRFAGLMPRLYNLAEAQGCN